MIHPADRRSARRLVLLALALVLPASPRADAQPQKKSPLHATVTIAATVPTTPEYPPAVIGKVGGSLAVVQPFQASAPGRFTVTVVQSEKGNQPTSGYSPLTVTYSVSGSATSGADYVALKGSVTVPAGASAAEILVYAVEDGLFEGDETVVVTLTATPTSGYAVDPVSSSATVTIRDSSNRVTIALAKPALAIGGASSGHLAVTREGPTTSSLEVEYSVAGDAVAGADYAALPGSVTIPAGASSASLAVTPLPSPLPGKSAGPKSLTVSLRAGSRYEVGSPSKATVAVAP